MVRVDLLVGEVDSDRFDARPWVGLGCDETTPRSPTHLGHTVMLEQSNGFAKHLTTDPVALPDLGFRSEDVTRGYPGAGEVRADSLSEHLGVPTGAVGQPPDSLRVRARVAPGREHEVAHADEVTFCQLRGLVRVASDDRGNERAVLGAQPLSDLRGLPPGDVPRGLPEQHVELFEHLEEQSKDGVATALGDHSVNTVRKLYDGRRKLD